MTSMFMRIAVIGALLSSSMAVAQAGGAALPSAPSSANAAANEPIVSTGNKVATINITGALAGCNEGQRDFGALDKKFEPRQTELTNLSKELETLKNQANSATTQVARETLVKQIETKQKAFDRSRQDATDDYQNQQNEIASRILTKMAPVMVKYAADNGFGVLIDTTKQWPDGQVIWSSPNNVDITRAVIDEYNKQSGVAAPATPAAKPAATTSKPATTPK
jgi:Skp family chaperone for outer membrane proteins